MERKKIRFTEGADFSFKKKNLFFDLIFVMIALTKSFFKNKGFKSDIIPILRQKTYTLAGALGLVNRALAGSLENPIFRREGGV